MTWQDLIAVGLVLVAVAYVVRGVIRLFRRRGLPGCACCPQCPADEVATPLVDLQNASGNDGRSETPLLNPPIETPVR